MVAGVEDAATGLEEKKKGKLLKLRGECGSWWCGCEKQVVVSELAGEGVKETRTCLPWVVKDDWANFAWAVVASF
ncbi:hypothetical protein RJT34_23174 [Clitoria ternatea]|uniref:Uncharacterized protein n=1 Tax=Clitoria ternatea TaxID=43366 RepID=A0AAN9FM24_CLITE